jgi:hypothetical protein
MFILICVAFKFLSEQGKKSDADPDDIDDRRGIGSIEKGINHQKSTPPKIKQLVGG